MIIEFTEMIAYVLEWFKMYVILIKNLLQPKGDLALENLALRSQLALVQQEIINHKISKPICTPAFRQLWTFLSKVLPCWKSALFLVKPETVVRWHRTAF